MEVHRQTCQKCGSIDVRNIIEREANLPAIIYVRCAKCGELVARYQLSDYYHHGKGFDSYMHSHQVIAAESGREVLKMFKNVKKESTDGFKRVLDILSKEGKKI
jgi:hypothetical protein